MTTVKRTLKMLGAVFGSAVVAIALGRLHPFGDPHRNLRQPRETLLQGVPLPEDARRTLVAKCADCHSSSTHWPIYSRIAPASWLIDRDVAEGRRHLDLSAWRNMPADQRQALEQEIVQQTKKGAMPPPLYRLMHRRSVLEPREIAALAELAPIGGVELGSATPGDADRGRALFNRRCTGCHATDSDREGPHLRGVYGRRAGSVGGFRYSSAIRTSNVTWNDATLNRWLTDSDTMLQGTAMGFSVPKVQDRSDLIAFLKSLH